MKNAACGIIFPTPALLELYTLTDTTQRPETCKLNLSSRSGILISSFRLPISEFHLQLIETFFPDSGGFASELAQVVNFGAAHATLGEDFDFINDG